MKIYNKNKGSGAVIASVGSQRFVFAPGKFIEVPDEFGKQLVAKYPSFLQAVGSDGESAKAAVAAVSVTHAKALAAKDARITELEAEVNRLKNLVALTPPVPAEVDDSAEVSTSGEISAPRRGRRSKAEIAAAASAEASK